MAISFFLDVHAIGFQEKMTEMYKVLDSQDPLLCALVGAAHIDKCLVAILESMFVKSKATKLKHLNPESPAGVLGSLFTRAEFAYLLGLIDSQTLSNIGEIARIRNLFAHSEVPLTFQSEAVAKACKALLDPPNLVIVQDPNMSPEAREFFDNERNQPKRRFVDSVSRIVHHLAFLPSKLRQPFSPFKDVN